MADVTKFVYRLRRSREQAGFSKKELAKRAEVSRQAITNWEGVRPPEKGIESEKLNRLAVALQGTLGEYSVAEMLQDLGYQVRPPAIENEQQAALLRLFRVAPPEYQEGVVGGLQLTLRALGIEVE